MTHALQQGTREPEVTIRLSSNSAKLHNQVRYDLTCGAYRRVLASEDDLTLDLLTLPSRVIHRDLHDQMQQQQQQEQQQNKQSSKGWTRTFYTLLKHVIYSLLPSSHAYISIVSVTVLPVTVLLSNNRLRNKAIPLTLFINVEITAVSKWAWQQLVFVWSVTLMIEVNNLCVCVCVCVCVCGPRDTVVFSRWRRGAPTHGGSVP